MERWVDNSAERALFFGRGGFCRMFLDPKFSLLASLHAIPPQERELTRGRFARSSLPVHVRERAVEC